MKPVEFMRAFQDVDEKRFELDMDNIARVYNPDAHLDYLPGGRTHVGPSKAERELELAKAELELAKERNEKLQEQANKAMDLALNPPVFVKSDLGPCPGPGWELVDGEWRKEIRFGDQLELEERRAEEAKIDREFRVLCLHLETAAAVLLWVGAPTLLVWWLA